jgi:hypothetical protein
MATLTTNTLWEPDPTGTTITIPPAYTYTPYSDAAAQLGPYSTYATTAAYEPVLDEARLNQMIDKRLDARYGMSEFTKRIMLKYPKEVV